MSEHSIPSTLPVQERLEFRHVVGFPGYAVGSDGSVWSCQARGNVGGCSGFGPSCRSKWKPLRLYQNRRFSRHLRVRLYRERKGYRLQVHRLVLEAFVGPCPPGMECRHFPDRDPTNNRLENLRWGTAVENVNDTWLHGTRAKGSRVAQSKLTEADVRRIRELLAEGRLCQREIGELFGVASSSIASIKNRKAWSWLRTEGD
jgi:hypothetical protein